MRVFNLVIQKKMTLEQLRPLINEFLSTQPEHLLLILAKEEQTTDAVSEVIAHQLQRYP